MGVVRVEIGLNINICLVAVKILLDIKSEENVMNYEDFNTLVHSRASHRKFANDPVSDEEIRNVVEAARMAPSGHNFQPWKFIAIRSKDVIQKLEKAIDKGLKALYENFPEDFIKKMEGYRFFIDHFKDAPLSIAVLTTRYEYKPTDSIPKKFGVELPKVEHFDMELLGVGAAIQNMLLAAEAQGLASCWLVEPATYAQKAIEEVLEVEEGYNFISLIALGRPTKERKPAPKKGVDEILTIV